MFAAEACIPFFTSYAAVLSSSRAALHYQLSSFEATEGERIALEKLQDCYGEGRLENIALNPQTLVTSFLTPLTHAAISGKLCTNDQCDH